MLTGLTHFLCGVVAVIMFAVQSLGGLRANRLVTPVTQTVGLWIPAGPVQQSWQGVNLGSDLSLKWPCSLIDTWNITGVSHAVRPLILNHGSLDIQILMIVAFFLSAVFQFLSCADEHKYYKPLEEGRCNVSHFLDYGCSAPLMVLVVCSQLGITDLMTLLGAACNTWCCAVFSLLAELLFDEQVVGQLRYGYLSLSDGCNIPYFAVAHFASWLSIICAIATFFHVISIDDKCIGRKSRDAFLISGTVSAYFETMVFAAFGLVQFYSLYTKPQITEVKAEGGSDTKKTDTNKSDKARRVSIAMNVEFAYLIISLFGKLGLVVLVYTANMI